ncbi:MAG TPA: hypothetical protein VJZ99_00990 [Patescibacteria group bacterium]|nr:hypothetical protein [Patescibacteria group bacterium]
MKIFFKKNKNSIIFFSCIILGSVVFLFFPNLAQAGIGDSIAKLIAWILLPVIWLLGKLVSLFLSILIAIAQYNDFIKSAAVTYGWTIVRDFANMFFVLILLVIAFATILRVESYNLKTWLPKLVIMAILINFSKLICGVIIDFAQVIMLTFIGAVKEITGGTMIELLGVSKILEFNESEVEGIEVSGWTILSSVILGVIMMIVAVVVIVVMLMMIIVRMVMIWIYIVLSPLAYLLASFPQGKKYSERWWSDFSKNVIVGPIIAFFLWLSFASLGGVEGSAEMEKMGPAVAGVDVDSSGVSATITTAGSFEHMIKFLVSIGMLVGGLMIAQEMGGMAGKIAGKGMAKLQSMGAGAVKGVQRGAKRVTGIERAQNAVKAYKAKKESERQATAQRDAGVIQTGVGALKTALTQPLQWAKEKVKGSSSQKNIDKAREDIAMDQAEKENLENQRLELGELEGTISVILEQEENKQQEQQEIINKRDEDMKGLVQQWKDGDIDTIEYQKEMDQIKNEADQGLREVDEKYAIDQQKADVLSSYNELTGSELGSFDDIDMNRAKENMDNRISIMDAGIEGKEKNLASRIDKAKNVDKAFSITSAIILPFGLANKINRSGREDMRAARDQRSATVSKYKDEMKNFDDDELRKEMDNNSIGNRARRTAATLMLLERGGLSEHEAKIKRDDISKSYGRNQGVMEQLDSALIGNYQNLSQNFVEMQQTAEPSSDHESDEQRRSREYKHNQAQDKIIRGIVNGTIKLENITDQASLDLLMPKLAEVLSPTQFSSMHDKQTRGQQQKIELALKNLPASSENFGVRVALAGLDGSLDAFDDNSEKERYLSGIKESELRKLTSSVKGLESLRSFFADTGRIQRLQNLAASNDQEKFREGLNGMLRKMQLDTSTSHQAITRSVMDFLRRGSA